MIYDPIQFKPYPTSLITEEISGIYGQQLLKDIADIIKLYNIYDKGANFTTEGTLGDYTPSDLRYRIAASLINKEARFLFAKTPEFNLKPTDQNVRATDSSSTQQLFLNEVLKKNAFSRKLVQAAKDSLIGKRVACVLNFNDDGIQINFIPSFGFIYDTEIGNDEILTKIIAFSTVVESDRDSEMRIYKKKYEMKNGYCYVSESIYDGGGKIIEVLLEEQQTLFNYIPAVVIRNDGLTGDLKGESEIENLENQESWFSKLANADNDALRKGMNQIKYTVDMSPESTAGLSTAPGAFWDLSTDQNTADKVSGQIGTLDPNMNYSETLKENLNRIKGNMYDFADIPNIAQLEAQMASGKALKAIYWPLIVRCDEKMLSWKPALEKIAKAILDGVGYYPNSNKYLPILIPKDEYIIEVTNQYPLPEDEEIEKQIDLSEVGNNTMSKKSYIMKWRRLTPDEADAELEQIAKERQLLEDSFFNIGNE